MKKIFTYIAAALVLAACAHDNGFRETGRQGDFSFKLVSSQPETKAEKTLVGSTKENRVESIDYYFYADTTANEVAHGRYTPTNPDDGSWTLPFTVGTGPLDGKTLNDLFPGGKECIVFFVANLAEKDVPTGLSLVNLKKTAVAQTFASEDKKTVLHENYMANFYMTAQVKLSPDDTGDKAAEEIEAIEVGLKRIAVKMDYDVRIVPSIEFNKGEGENAYREVWTPMLNDHNVRIYLENAVFNSVLGAGGEAGKVDGAMTYYLPETYTQVSYDPTFLTLNKDLVEGKKQMTSQAFFTYPMRWTEGDAHEPNVKLIVPWRVERYQKGITDPVYKTEREMYYKIMLPESVLNANEWFKMTIDVTIIGSEAGDPEVVIPAQYTVINWITGAGDGVNTDILDAKYLSVDVMKQNGKNLPFQVYSVSGSTTYASSHKVNMEIVDIYQVNLTGADRYLYQNGAVVSDLSDFHTIDPETGEERPLMANDVTGWVTHQENAGGGLVEIKHVLNNNMLSDYFDATEYVYTIKLTLSADASYTETIQFIQYPALYVKAYESPRYNVYVKRSNTEGDNIYDDSGQQNAQSYMGRIRTYNGQSTSNYNNISVSVSILTDVNTVDGMQMVIGDPRGAATTISGLSNLVNYRPAAEDTKNVVAPKFLVASSRGATTPTSYVGAQKRCAAYQENGYPAGRWRLPTMAEIQFLISLSEKEKIEPLFEPDETSYYWASGNMGYAGNDTWRDFSSASFSTWTTPWGTYPGYYSNFYVGQDRIGVWTRCVYDEWYWAQYDEENDPNKETDIDKLANPGSWGGYQTTIPDKLPIQNL